MRTVSIVGARPQFVKLAPVSRAMAALGASGGAAIEDVIVHTGQHYDPGLSDIFFTELEIPHPDIDLKIGSGSHGQQSARMLEGIEQVLVERTPDVVVVYGDTNSTLAGALAAAKLHIPIAHVEAGLRSFDRHMPEEVNRLVADHLSEVLLAPTQTAMENLTKENLVDRAVLTGDVMLDAIRFNRDLSLQRSAILTELALEPQSYGVVTLHRAANTDSERLIVILETLDEVAEQHLPLVFPVHPRTVARIGSDYPDWQPGGRLRLIDPVGYLDMVRLVDSAAIVLTDSGGLQKEAFFLDAPCVTLRNKTEWPETVDGGGNVLTGAEPERILAAVGAVMGGSGRPATGAAEAYFGDGHAADKIVQEIVKLAG